MTDLIKTERLVLRRCQISDAADITRLISDWDVIKWLTSPPYPYALKDAEQYLNNEMSQDSFAITLDDQYVGTVGMHDAKDPGGTELGYWLGKPYWGQGLMTEAAKAVLVDQFEKSDDLIVSGYLEGNVASNNVLYKLGFQNTELVMRDSIPWGKKMPLQRVALTRDRWQARHG